MLFIYRTVLQPMMQLWSGLDVPQFLKGENIRQKKISEQELGDSRSIGLKMIKQSRVLRLICTNFGSLQDYRPGGCADTV